jgi:di/tricarboxylate transporter
VSDRTPTLSWRFAAPIVVWLALLLIPHPTGLSPIAWRYLGLFAGEIVALVLEPLPPAAVGLTGVSLAKVLGDVAPFNRPAGPVDRGRGFPGPGQTHPPG